MGRGTEQTFFPKKTCRWPTGTWKDAQHHSLLEQCKPKLQWITISQQSEWPSLQTTNAGKDMKKKSELFYTVVTINWYSHHRKEYRGSSEK